MGWTKLTACSQAAMTPISSNLGAPFTGISLIHMLLQCGIESPLCMHHVDLRLSVARKVQLSGAYCQCQVEFISSQQKLRRSLQTVPDWLHHGCRVG